MGTTNNIKETNIGQGLINKKCEGCSQLFTEKDICESNNWEVQFDTSNDVKIEDNEIKGYGYNLTIWIRNAYHEDCQQAEEENKKVEEVKEKVGLHGINEVMEGVMESQRRHVERMKKQDKKK